MKVARPVRWEPVGVLFEASAGDPTPSSFGRAGSTPARGTIYRSRAYRAMCLVGPFCFGPQLLFQSSCGLQSTGDTSRFEALDH